MSTIKHLPLTAEIVKNENGKRVKKMNHPPMSRRARKDLANNQVKYFRNTRKEAKAYARVVSQLLSELWFEKKVHKNPRQRSSYMLFVPRNYDNNGVPDLGIYCGQNKKPIVFK